MNTINADTAGGKAFSIDEFCTEHNISRATYYNLIKAGKAPQQ